MELYHATSWKAAKKIDASRRMRPGTHGFAGGAIYFSSTPEAACRKYRNGRGDPDIVIFCEVDLGEMLEAEKNTVDMSSVVWDGYDSVKIWKLDVYAVLDPDRVEVLQFRRPQGDSWCWYDSIQELVEGEGQERRERRAALRQEARHKRQWLQQQQRLQQEWEERQRLQQQQEAQQWRLQEELAHRREQEAALQREAQQRLWQQEKQRREEEQRREEQQRRLQRQREEQQRQLQQPEQPQHPSQARYFSAVGLFRLLRCCKRKCSVHRQNFDSVV